jgi:3',5'-nucleoside bisphosphate phosphatase
MYCDLHFHTFFSSDGYCVPEEVVPLMVRSKCKGFSCTDHNSLEAIPIFLEHAENNGLEFIPGVEIDTRHPTYGDLHLLAYNFDLHHKGLNEILETERNLSNLAYESVLDSLISDGIISDRRSFEEFAKGSWPRRSIGYKQIHHYLIQCGFANDMSEAKSMFETRRTICGYNHKYLHPVDVMQTVKAAGGVCVLAHPAASVTDNMEMLIDEMILLGVVGIEAYTPRNLSGDNIRRIVKMGNGRGVILTGGSDYHGSSSINKWPSKVPYSCFQALLETTKRY